MPEDDASLVLKAAADPAAFADLLRRHGQAIHAYLSRRTDRDAADDLLGEVWLRAYAARRTYDQRWPDARPWLYGIARNVLREHWRRRRGVDLFDGGGIEDPWPEVDARLDAAARLAELRRALAALQPGDREVLLLVTWEGLAPAEAAIALGIRPGTARSRLFRARTLMRQSLAPDGASPNYQEA